MNHHRGLSEGWKSQEGLTASAHRSAPGRDALDAAVSQAQGPEAAPTVTTRRGSRSIPWGLLRVAILPCLTLQHPRSQATYGPLLLRQINTYVLTPMEERPTA
jgi:hypothetical protein